MRGLIGNHCMNNTTILKHIRSTHFTALAVLDAPQPRTTGPLTLHSPHDMTTDMVASAYLETKLSSAFSITHTI
eukprot:26437-Eustigmatos_ZCMA.PRE.1